MQTRHVFAILCLLSLSVGASYTQEPTIPIALSGEPAPGAPGRTFLGFGPPAIHESGQIIFGAYLDPSDYENDLGLWVGTPGNIRLAVREGDVAPGTGGRRFEGFAPHEVTTRLTPYHPQMNGDGKIAFRGALKGSPEGQGGGVWAGLPGNLELIALAGDPVPGVPGRTFLAFRQPFIDEAGNVLFRAILDDFSDGIWYSNPNGLTTVMARGLPATGLPPFTFFATSNTGYSLDPQGHVFFTASLRDALGNGSSALWTGDPLNPGILAAVGDIAPGIGVPFSAVHGTQTGNDGAVLIQGAIQGNFTEALWIGIAENLVPVPGVRRGEIAPGTSLPFYTLSNPAMNELGQVVVVGDLDPVPHDNHQDMGFWTDARGVFELIVRQGDIAPGTDGALFHQPGSPTGNTPFLPASINAEGTVVFQSKISNGTGIWMWNNGELEPVISTARPYEVTGCDERNVHFVFFNGALGRWGHGGIYGQNDAGQIAFHVTFQDPDTFELSFGLFVTGDDDSCGGEPPDCSMATASATELWPPDRQMESIEILGVEDPSVGEPLLDILAVTSDEPAVHSGTPHAPDAEIALDGTVSLRAERLGGSNGRVYEIVFSAKNDDGSCEGSVQVSVPHDRSGDAAIDDGQAHDATAGG